MTTSTKTARRRGDHRSARRPARAALIALAALVAAGGSYRLASESGPGPGVAHAAPAPQQGPGHEMSAADRATAMLATAGFQDVATAEANGYGSSLYTLGCFQNPAKGGMGLHLINEDLLDATLDPSQPEALVYELGLDGEPTGLVAHEYIVPIDAWTAPNPPRLFGVDLHEHPTLPLFVLHTWLWKDNPNGTFEDWNPAVRLCPAGVPIFGVDLPAPADS
jgi:hypothetical protein